MGISSLASFLLGSWGCRYRELQPIAFGGHGSNTNAENGIENGEGSQGGDLEDGFIIAGSRGGGRTTTKRGSRGDLGGGDYEMVAMAGPSSSSGGGGVSGSGSKSGHHTRSQSTVSQAGGLGGPSHKAD